MIWRLDETLINRRMLIDVGIIKEVTLLEISPNGTTAHIKTKQGISEWRKISDIRVVDVFDKPEQIILKD